MAALEGFEKLPLEVQAELREAFRRGDVKVVHSFGHDETITDDEVLAALAKVLGLQQ